ncbi:MAG TPA: alpha-amylase/4-alpha-glucanotransferase domain-containing protein [Spirochaetia bacterium]|nr:alpha-amylase/4-alpha-glucanotransferase domain-containing protein [Spirochaetia bacterium]
MRKVKLILGTHNHIPIGTDQATAELRYQKAFKPLLAVLYRYPDFPVALHYSGVLLEWLEEFHPEFLMLLEEMVKRGQVEVLGGGYFDPVLSLIPTNDKLGQLEKMTTWLRGRFEIRPRGCWIAEKVWEPSLASVLRVSGIDYTFLDDGQFRIAGVRDGRLLRPSIAEDQGKIISLFPISGDLRALAAREKPFDALAFLRAIAEEESSDPRENAPLAILLEDGIFASEGLLRGDWLETFITTAEKNVSWLQATTPGQYLKEHPPVERLYVPSLSSMDMMGWALSPDVRGTYLEARQKSLDQSGEARFLVGGHFRQFLTRYPEAWLMYAKMMYTHVIVNQVRGDRYKKKAAQNELWKGQCHFAYWSGIEGGIYDNLLRKAVYHSLIEAEKITRATEIFVPSIMSVDYDLDNGIEYLYQGSELNAYIHARGGVLFELDFLPASWNYLDTMVQRDMAQPSGEQRAETRDPAAALYPRKAFLDHFLAPTCSLDDFRASACGEAGDFITGPYDLVELNRALPELLMRRTGAVKANGRCHMVGIEKKFVFRPRSIDVYYKVSNLGDDDMTARFGVEMNVSLAARSVESGRLFLLDEDRKSEISSEPQEIDGAPGLLVRDVRNEVSITLSSAKPFLCWSFPLETLSPGWPDRPPIFQAHCFIQQWDLHLQPAESWENHLSVGFEKTQGT